MSVFRGRDERLLAGWLLALFAITQASHGLGANAADTLFFLRFGVDELPRMILLSGFVVMAGLILHAKGLGRSGARAWLWVVTVGCAALSLVEWLVVLVGLPGAYPIVWISTQVVIMVSFAVMWNAAGAGCTTRQAKRLFPLFATAGVAGGIVGNLSTGPATALLGAENLLLVQAGLLAGSAIVLVRLRSMLGGEDSAVVEDDSPEVASVVSMVRSSRLLRLGAVAGFAGSVLWFLVVFPFSEAVTASFESEAELAAFLGVFSSIATVLTFLVSLFVTKRLFARAGVVVALLTVPVVYLVGFGAWVAGFGLGSAVAFRGAQWVAVNAIGATAYTALFNVFTGRRRGEIVSFMLAVPRQLGSVAAGVILIAVEGSSRSVTFFIGLGAAAVMLVVVVAMRRAYVEAVVTAVRRGLIGLFDPAQAGLISVTDGDVRRVIEDRMQDERPEARAVAVRALARLAPEGGAKTVSRLLDDPNARVRVAAFEALEALDPGEAGRVAARVLHDDSAEIRVLAARRIVMDAGESQELLARLAREDPDPRVRVAAAVRIGRDGAPTIQNLLESDDGTTVAAVLDELAGSVELFDVGLVPYLGHPHVMVRVAAARCLAELDSEADGLRTALDDTSLRVRRAAAAALARSDAGRALLLDVLEHGSVNATDAALEVLVPFTDPTESTVAGWARREAERAAFLLRIADALGGEPEDGAVDYLGRVLRARSDRLVHWVIRALTTEGTRDAMAVVAKGIRSTDEETRSQAIEALESVSRGAAVSMLLPLLEPDPAGSQMSERAALRRLSEDFDPWLRALAIRSLADTITSDLQHLQLVAGTDESDLVRRALPSYPIMPADHVESLDTMERVLALQRAEMFHQLDPEDLELIAAAATERHHEPGEVIMRRGEEGREMLVLVDGYVDIDTGDPGGVIRREPGEHIGEMALLGSGLRSVDVVVGADGLHALVLSQSDLLAVLEERPVVALGMLNTLTKRLADAT